MFTPFEDDKQHQPYITKENTKPAEKISSKPYELKMNYRDPFKVDYHPRKKKKKLAIQANTIQTRTIKKTVTNRIWPNIEFKGRIKNHSNKTSVAVIKINNEKFRVKQGETLQQELKVLQIWKDSVLLSQKQNQRTFYLQN
jgi:Tfp pilus assembly protein PilP